MNPKLLQLFSVIAVPSTESAEADKVIFCEERFHLTKSDTRIDP